mmetsp:Transcript_28404/g.67823  ORF Transcript_28404/g.67823 Transcript_28404/m.67823 type:complete len:201 (+) Transcript_28404:600-1202(+)
MSFGELRGELVRRRDRPDPWMAPRKLHQLLLRDRTSPGLVVDAARVVRGGGLYRRLPPQPDSRGGQAPHGASQKGEMDGDGDACDVLRFRALQFRAALFPGRATQLRVPPYGQGADLGLDSGDAPGVSDGGGLHVCSLRCHGLRHRSLLYPRGLEKDLGWRAQVLVRRVALPQLDHVHHLPPRLLVQDSVLADVDRVHQR